MHFFTISILFNFFWFVAVIGRQHTLPFLIFALVVIFVIRSRIILPALTMAMIGIIGDSLLSFSKILVFEVSILPLWLCSLWLAFAVYIWLGKSFLLQKPKWLLLSAGSIGGALSYIAGQKLGAVDFHYALMPTSIALCFAWLCYSLFFVSILEKWSDNEKLTN